MTIFPWSYSPERFEALWRQREHLPNHAICPLCGLAGLRLEFTRSQKRPGATFIKCYCCGLHNTYCTDMNAVYHILGLSNMVKEMDHPDRILWLQKIQESGNIFLQEIEFHKLVLSGSSKSREIAVHSHTEQPRYVLCLTCGDPTAEIRKDKKGRIYLSHQFCGNRWFTHTPHSAIHFIGFTNLFGSYEYQSVLDSWNQTGKNIWLNWTRGINIESTKGERNVSTKEHITIQAK